jgi:hypothetical protein
MGYWPAKFVLLFVVGGKFLAFLVASFATIACAGSAQAALVGHWTFDGPNPLKDLTGNFADLQLNGDASIVNGQLNVNGSGTSASGWAVTNGAYTGAAITEKTLVSWLTLESFSTWSGSALTIDKKTVDVFDGIVFGERQTNRWMAGSNSFSRTQDFNPGYQETAPGSLIQMAITYQNSSGQALIKSYRNGALIGSYTKGSIPTFVSGDTEVLFGLRHTLPSGQKPGALDALIEEARIYNTVLSQAEIAALSPRAVPGPLPLLGALAALDRSRRLRSRRRHTPGDV